LPPQLQTVPSAASATVKLAPETTVG